MVLVEGTSRAPFGRRAIVNGALRAIVVREGRVVAVAAFTTSGGGITSLNLVADPDKLRHVRV